MLTLNLFLEVTGFPGLARVMTSHTWASTKATHHLRHTHITLYRTVLLEIDNTHLRGVTGRGSTVKHPSNTVEDCDRFSFHVEWAVY